MKSSDPTVINAWREWDPLRHMIVGRIDKTSTVPSKTENPLGIPNWGVLNHYFGYS